MGLFDIFKSNSDRKNPSDKSFARLGRIVGDRLAQSYDRRDAIASLAASKSAEAVSMLLRRFTFHVNPSTDDQEEKDAAFQAIVACGEDAVGPVLIFSERAESLAWLLKMLRVLLEEEKYFGQINELLKKQDTDYQRNVEPKNQLLAALEGRSGETTTESVLPFLQDVNEPIRFQAVVTLLSLQDECVIQPLIALALEEESVRIRNKVAEGFQKNGWELPTSVEFSQPSESINLFGS